MKKLLPFLILFFSVQLSAQWTTLSPPTSNVFLNCTFPSDDTGYMSFNTGLPYIYRTFDGGVSFDSITIPSMTQCTSIHFRTTTEGCASGSASPNGYGVFRTFNAGTTWTDISPSNALGSPVMVKFADVLHGTYINSAPGILNTSNGGI